MRLGIIGCGAVAETLLKGLAAADAQFARLVCLARPQSRGRAEALIAAYPAAAERRVVGSVDELTRSELDLVVECAGQDALQALGITVLAAGIDLVPASIGALADEALHRTLREAAAASGARLRLPAGAIGGLDLIGAARLAGIERVMLVSRKPPAAWRGTRAERLIDLGNVTCAVTFYRGSARDAAREYPKNANVAAAVALAGAGFEATAVELVADPAARGNSHEITVSSACADLHLRIDGRASPDNPKTSLTTGYGLARLVLNHAATEII